MTAPYCSTRSAPGSTPADPPTVPPPPCSATRTPSDTACVDSRTRPAGHCRNPELAELTLAFEIDRRITGPAQ